MVIWIKLGGIVLLGLVTAIFIRQSSTGQTPVGMAADFDAGKLTSSVTVNSQDELGNLGRIFNRTAQTLNGYISEISGFWAVSQTEILRGCPS
jgi:methyl-accepting chemotaxis protein